VIDTRRTDVRTELWKLLIPGAMALAAATAAAQPIPPIPLPPPTAGDPPITDPVLLGASRPPAPIPAPVDEPPTPVVEAPPITTVADAVEAPPADPEPPAPRIPLPEVLLAPSAIMLPGGAIYSRTGVDTGGGVSSDLRLGLGDVGEFGVLTSDLIRARVDAASTSERLAPYLMATFRMGVAEDRLFRYQPALAVGFRKSFEFSEDGHRSKVAELYVAASRRLGTRATIHVNGSVWDALVQNDGEAAVVLHDRGLGKQVRAGGGLELRAVDDSDVLVDVAWVPELCFTCVEANRIKLRPILSWGVRYHLAPWATFQAGVRVPDIGNVNLLDAQIFGQLTIVNTSLRRLVKRAQPRPTR